MESQPQNPEFRNNTENFHPCRPEKISAQTGKQCRFRRDGSYEPSHLDLHCLLIQFAFFLNLNFCTFFLGFVQHPFMNKTMDSFSI